MRKSPPDRGWVGVRNHVLLPARPASTNRSFQKTQTMEVLCPTRGAEVSGTLPRFIHVPRRFLLLIRYLSFKGNRAKFTHLFQLSQLGVNHGYQWKIVSETAGQG